MNNKPIKVYELYPSNGGLSVKTIDYQGEIFGVASISVKQAYYFVYNKVWAYDIENPLGIIWTYNKWNDGPDTRFWNGATGYGCGPRHNTGKKDISAWMKILQQKQYIEQAKEANNERH